MKLTSILLYPLLVWMAVGMLGCAKDTVTEHYTFYRPVYTTMAKVKEGIKNMGPTAVVNPGKLVVKDNYIFLSETGKGIHIIDRSNPRVPGNIAFISLPGNADIAVRGDYLYADCYTHLAVVNIANPVNVKLVRFLDKVFPDRYYGLAADGDQIIASWQRIDTVVSHRFSESFDKTLDNSVLYYTDNASVYSIASNSGGKSNSTGGSMARFALMDDRMYAVGTSNMKIFNTADASNPSFVKDVSLQWGIETIFPYKQNLFIGTQIGMLIYNVTDKDNPIPKGGFSHARKCDPVIADGNYAYVTLRAGGPCGGGDSELDVLDISNLSSPGLLQRYLHKAPKGLAKDGNVLLVCDSDEGLIVYNAARPDNLSVVKQVKGFDAYDVIAQNGIALVSAVDGLYFVDYSEPTQATVISRIALSTK